jgi:hypothetical protein
MVLAQGMQIAGDSDSDGHQQVICITNARETRHAWQVLITAFYLLLAARAAWSQETTTGSIAGRVVDEQNLAVPGATVTTDSDGRFFAPFLTPGRYEVKVEIAGFRTIDRQNIDVRLGQRVELSLQLQVGDVSQTVNVTAESPIVHTSSTTTGAVLDSDTLARLPIGRRFSDTLYVTPGVSSGGQVGQANPSMSGGSGLENQYVVDGVNITNAGNGVPFDFIREERVKTNGYEAEFGQSTGGVVNVITKSRTNALRAGLFGYFRPEGLENAYDRVSTVNGTVNVTGTRSIDAGLTTGGAIVLDRLFFFGAAGWAIGRTSG